jgi:hypothetical protein
MAAEGSRVSLGTRGQSAMDTVLTFIPPGHTKAVRSAIYNTVALGILGVVVLLASSVYLYVLRPYLRPLLWAGLCGSVLYPLKVCVKRVFIGLLFFFFSSRSIAQNM